MGLLRILQLYRFSLSLHNRTLPQNIRYKMYIMFSQKCLIRERVVQLVVVHHVQQKLPGDCRWYTFIIVEAHVHMHVCIRMNDTKNTSIWADNT